MFRSRWCRARARERSSRTFSVLTRIASRFPLLPDAGFPGFTPPGALRRHPPRQGEGKERASVWAEHALAVPVAVCQGTSPRGHGDAMLRMDGKRGRERHPPLYLSPVGRELAQDVIRGRLGAKRRCRVRGRRHFRPSRKGFSLLHKGGLTRQQGTAKAGPCVAALRASRGLRRRSPEDTSRPRLLETPPFPGRAPIRPPSPSRAPSPSRSSNPR